MRIYIFKPSLILAGLVTLFPLIAKSADFRAADALFAKRGQGYGSNNFVAINNTQLAINAYRAMVPQLRGQDLIYAEARIGQLTHFWGDILTDENNKEQRLSIFGGCEREIENINPRLVGENAPYYYFKGLCGGFYAEAGNLLAKLSRTGLYKRGSAQDVLYRAIVFASRALALPTGTDGLSGADYCDNYRFLGLAYLALRTPDRTRASATFHSALNYFAASRSGADVTIGYLPEGQEPETQSCIQRIYTILDANHL